MASPRVHITVISAGTLATAGPGTVEAMLGKLKATRARALGQERGAGAYRGLGDVVLVLTDQGAGREVAERLEVQP